MVSAEVEIVLLKSIVRFQIRSTASNLQINCTRSRFEIIIIAFAIIREKERINIRTYYGEILKSAYLKARTPGRKTETT